MNSLAILATRPHPMFESGIGDGRITINAAIVLASTSVISVLTTFLGDPITAVNINYVIIDTETATKGPLPPENQNPASCKQSAMIIGIWSQFWKRLRCMIARVAGMGITI